METSIYELVRKQEQQYVSGTTNVSKYVQKSMYEDLSKIDAYINSQHISGKQDSQGRDKPFFNIVTAARNIWFRATDIDRKSIKIKASRQDQYVTAFLATVHLQDWMKKANFGMFLNDWGRVLATYGSAVIKFIEKDGQLVIMNVPWNQLIVDAISFYDNPVIEKLYLTPAQLKQRKGYDQKQVDQLLQALQARKDLNKQNKDTKNDYIEVYEIHGNMSKAFLTGKEKDFYEYEQQMHVVTFLKGTKGTYEDYALYKGKEKKSPYMITHLIEEEGQTLSIGAVQNLFEAQWMMNYTAKSIKDQLDLASKMVFQTSDSSYLGTNALTNIENGDILIHKPDAPLTELSNTNHDITALQGFAQQWKTLGNEINGISESMLGQNPPSNSAWRQTEALLQESHSLFEIMTENKGLYIETMMREFIIPYIRRTKLNTSDEIAATLDSQGITQFDSMYVPVEATRRANDLMKRTILGGGIATQPDMASIHSEIQDGLNSQGSHRFLKPSDISTKTWLDIFKDFEWTCIVDVTGESQDQQSVMETLNTVFTTIARNPAVLDDPNAKLVFNKILEFTGTISPLEMMVKPPQPAAPNNKVIESIAFKDLPPEGQAQLAKQAGINLQPEPAPATASPSPGGQP